MAVAAMYRGRTMSASASFIKINGAAAKSQLHRIFVFAPRGENSTIFITFNLFL
jgi:tRNA(Met) C34 N-acetyltransferase TmcA